MILLYVFYLHVCVHTTSVPGDGGQMAEGVRLPGTGVTGGSDLSWRCWEPTPVPRAISVLSSCTILPPSDVTSIKERNQFQILLNWIERPRLCLAARGWVGGYVIRWLMFLIDPFLWFFKVSSSIISKQAELRSQTSWLRSNSYQEADLWELELQIFDSRA